MSDCDANGQLDYCQLEEGTLTDEDLDGLPDACSCIADVTGDSVVNVDDLIAVILAWGPCARSCPADVNGSGAVDVDDLVAVILAWDQC